MQSSAPLQVDANDVEVLRRVAESARSRPAEVRRARIVLLSAEGLGPVAVAERLGCSRQTVLTWRERYRADGVDGLRDAPRSGRPATVDELAVVSRTLDPPPGPRPARWSTRRLGADLGISNAAVANVWRAWGLWPCGVGTFRFCTEPVLDERIADVIGLHVSAGSRLLALVTGVSDAGVAGAAATGGRPDLLSLLVRTDPGVPPNPVLPDPAPVAAFLDGLPRPPRLRIVADRASAALQSWSAVRSRECVVHVTASTGAWARLAHVMCALASGAAVTDLARALDTYSGPGPFSWVSDNFCKVGATSR